jgi:hypothetical protein
VADVHHVAILHHVFFAFQAKSSFGSRCRFRARVEQVIPADGFSANEVMLEVGVDRPGTLRRLRANRNGPSAALVLACGEEADEPLQFVALANQPDQAAFVQSVAG